MLLIINLKTYTLSNLNLFKYPIKFRLVNIMTSMRYIESFAMWYQGLNLDSFIY